MMAYDTRSYVVWMLLVGSIVWVGVGVISGTSNSAFYAVPLIVLGGTYATHAIYRLRSPRWFEHDWWKHNRYLAFALIGSRPGSWGRLGEATAALLQLGFGIVMLVVGVLAATSAI